MTSKALVELDAHYRALEDRWTLEDRSRTYSRLVVPNGNSDRPFHRWFHFKEGYSSDLLARILQDTQTFDSLQRGLLDPFTGSGTTLISGVELARQTGQPLALRGVERNPAIHLIASAKLLGVSHGADLRDRVEAASPSFWQAFQKERGKNARGLQSRSSTLSNPNYFRAEDVNDLVALGRAASTAADGEVRTVLRACAAISVEAVGRLRRDGRALRFQPRKEIKSPQDAFASALSVAREDMASVAERRSTNAEIALGDARDPHPGDAKFGVAVFSPPYPNNIDYTEVYKTEAWALEMFRNASDVRAQRLLTLRSHPSVTFPDSYGFEVSDVALEVRDLVSPILAAVPDDRYAKGRRQLISGYVDDMLRVLISTRGAMEVGSLCAVVVGNSSHGHGTEQFLIAADLLIARLGELASWTVDSIWIARHPRRRVDQQGRLRESVVLLRAS